MRGRAEPEGQASVEFLALLPVLALLVLAGWQALLVGHSWWLAGIAARAGSRAALVGRDPGAAARRVLPRGHAARLRVRADDDRVTVSLAVPRVVPGLRAMRVGAGAGVGAR